ncbi:unnamed protein product [Amoebophrya sp. A25]|nr:unnamed protein product [Amoebophrya sp. A25]|eukprot:GSA25T00003318001.1
MNKMVSMPTAYLDPASPSSLCATVASVRQANKGLCFLKLTDVDDAASEVSVVQLTVWNLPALTRLKVADRIKATSIEPDPYAPVSERSVQAYLLRDGSLLEILGSCVDSVRSVATYAGVERFHFTPDNVRWGSSLRRMRVGAVNVLSWSGDSEDALPIPPYARSNFPSDNPKILSPILLPTTDTSAVAITRHQEALRVVGWRVCCPSDPELVEILRDKAQLVKHAEAFGLRERHFPWSVNDAEIVALQEPPYKRLPAVWKPRYGQFGRGVRLIETEGELDQLIAHCKEKHGDATTCREVGGFPMLGVLQEYVGGARECSASLLVWKGKIVDSVVCEYYYHGVASSSVCSGTSKKTLSPHCVAALPDSMSSSSVSASETRNRDDGNIEEEASKRDLEAEASMTNQCGGYEHASSEVPHIWPQKAVEDRTKRRFLELPRKHAQVFEQLLTPAFSGVCNFNYKVVIKQDEAEEEKQPVVEGEDENSSMIEALRIFECNPRPGGDLIQDAPREIGARFLEKLDSLLREDNSASTASVTTALSRSNSTASSSSDPSNATKLSNPSLVSVVMPCYNAAEDLDACIESIVKQTYPNLELVCHDDCSSRDNTRELLLDWLEACQKVLSDQRRDKEAQNGASDNSSGSAVERANEWIGLGEQDRKFRRRDVLRQRRLVQGRANCFSIVLSFGAVNRGEGFARNEAVRHAKGDYLCTMDADDLMHPDRIISQYKLCLVHPDALIGGNFERVPEGSTHRYTTWANGLSAEGVYLDQYREVTMIHPTWFMRREVFERAGGYHERELQGANRWSDQVNIARGAASCLAAGLTEAMTDFPITSSEAALLEKTSQERDDAQNKWRSPLAADLRFFHCHLDAGGSLRKVDDVVLTYRHRPGASLCAETSRRILFEVRCRALERRVLLQRVVRAAGDGEEQQGHIIKNHHLGGQLVRDWRSEGFTIWGCGRDGKLFFQTLSEVVKRNFVNAFCDVAERRLLETTEITENGKRRTTRRKRTVMSGKNGDSKGGSYCASTTSTKPSSHMRTTAKRFYVHCDYGDLKIPILAPEEAKPLFIICVAKCRYYAEVMEVMRTRIPGGENLVEGRDYWFFC